jgi:integrase
MPNDITPMTPAVEDEVLPPERRPAQRPKSKALAPVKERKHIRTAADVSRAAPGRWRDAKSHNLYLWVSPKGVRRFLYRYVSPLTGKPNEHGLGELSLADARKKALELHGVVAGGIDPIAAKKNDRAMTFRQAAEAWVEINVHSASRMKDAKQLLFVHGEPLADILVTKISADVIEQVLKTKWGVHLSPQGRRAMAMWARVLSYAKQKGWRTGDNPASWRDGMEHRFARQSADRPHHKMMSYKRTPEFMEALRQKQDGATSAIALEFLVLTAARTGEVRGARWDEISWDEKVWTQPAARTKQRREHRVPLSSRAMEILDLQRQYGGSEYIFSGYSRGRAPLTEKAMSLFLRGMGHKVSVHGFRRTFRTWAGEKTHHPRELIEYCLAHQVGNQVEGAYWGGDALERRRLVMQDWADFCAARAG